LHYLTKILSAHFIFKKKKKKEKTTKQPFLLDKERHCPVSINIILQVHVKNSTQKHLKMDKAIGKAFTSRDEGCMQALKRISMGITRLV